MRASSGLIPSLFVRPCVTFSHILFADGVMMVYSKASPIAAFHLKSVDVENMSFDDANLMEFSATTLLELKFVFRVY